MTAGENDLLIKKPQRLRWLLWLFYLASSIFKMANADLRFVFLTGLTKCAQLSVFSGFNRAGPHHQGYERRRYCHKPDLHYKEVSNGLLSLEASIIS